MQQQQLVGIACSFSRELFRPRFPYYLDSLVAHSDLHILHWDNACLAEPYRLTLSPKALPVQIGDWTLILG